MSSPTLSLDPLSEWIEMGETERPGFSSTLHLIHILLDKIAPSPGPRLLYNPTLWQDLRIFCPNGVFQQLHRCQTYPGILLLYRLLSEPRQHNGPWHSLFRSIFATPEKRATLDTCRTHLIEFRRQHQEHLIWFWKERTPEEDQELKACFFQHKCLQPLNHNWWVTFIHDLLRIWIQPAYTALAPVLSLIFPYIYLRRKLGVRVSILEYIRILRTIVPEASALLSGSRPKAISWISLSSIATIVLYIRGVYSEVQGIQRIKATTARLKQRLLSLVHMVELTQQLSPILGVSTTSPPPPPPVLMDLNDSSSRVTVLWTYWQMTHDPLALQTLIPYMYRMGLCDAFVSVADFIEEARTQGLPICFAEPRASPTLTVHDTWHPSLIGTPIVLNSLCLGGNHRRNLLITGPNAGGKSTVVKSVAVNILLMQSLGIACARSFHTLPYAVLYTHLRISDEEGKRSLFQEEMERVHFLLGKAPHFRFFAVFDELFSSTSALEGMSCAYALAETLGKMHHGTTMITTHYPFLTRLEKESPMSSYMNCEMECRLDDQGNPHFQYRLCRGVSTIHVALRLLQSNRVTHSVVERAKHLLDQQLEESK